MERSHEAEVAKNKELCEELMKLAQEKAALQEELRELRGKLKKKAEKLEEEKPPEQDDVHRVTILINKWSERKVST